MYDVSLCISSCCDHSVFAWQAIGRLGVPMSQQELTAIARRIDVDGDGTLNYYEFSKLIDLDPWEM